MVHDRRASKVRRRIEPLCAGNMLLHVYNYAHDSDTLSILAVARRVNNAFTPRTDQIDHIVDHL